MAFPDALVYHRLFELFFVDDVVHILEKGFGSVLLEKPEFEKLRLIKCNQFSSEREIRLLVDLLPYFHQLFALALLVTLDLTRSRVKNARFVLLSILRIHDQLLKSI